MAQLRPVYESLWRDWGNRYRPQLQRARCVDHTGNHIAIVRNIHRACHGRGSKRDDRRAIGSGITDNNRLACRAIFDPRQPRCAKLRLGYTKAVNSCAAKQQGAACADKQQGAACAAFDQIIAITAKRLVMAKAAKGCAIPQFPIKRVIAGVAKNCAIPQCAQIESSPAAP